MVHTNFGSALDEKIFADGFTRLCALPRRALASTAMRGLLDLRLLYRFTFLYSGSFVYCLFLLDFLGPHRDWNKNSLPVATFL